nr:MAG TPA: hypothetical protein [Caudoviricetes sp.]
MLLGSTEAAALLQDKKITIYNSRNWAGEIPAQSLIKHIS